MDEFQSHLNKQKRSKNPTQEQEYQIYNVNMVLDWITNSRGNDMHLISQNFAIDLVNERALQLGKQEWLVELWDCSNKLALRDQPAESSR